MAGLVQNASITFLRFLLAVSLLKRLTFCHLTTVSLLHSYLSFPANLCFLGPNHCPLFNFPHLGPDCPPPCAPDSPCPWCPGAANGWPCYECIKHCKQALQNSCPSTHLTIDAPTLDQIQLEIAESVVRDYLVTVTGSPHTHLSSAICLCSCLIDKVLLHIDCDCKLLSALQGSQAELSYIASLLETIGT